MILDTTVTNDLPIVCDPSALTAEQSERWMVVGKQMYQAIQEVRELPNGYAFRLASDAAILMIIAEDLTMERLCCPFLLYTLEIAQGGGPFWLSFMGPEGARDFLRFSFEESGILNEDVAKAAGFNVAAHKALDSVQTALDMTERINERTAQILNSNHK